MTHILFLWGYHHQYLTSHLSQIKMFMLHWGVIFANKKFITSRSHLRFFSFLNFIMFKIVVLSHITPSRTWNRLHQIGHDPILYWYRYRQLNVCKLGQPLNCHYSTEWLQRCEQVPYTHSQSQKKGTGLQLNLAVLYSCEAWLNV